MGPSQRTTAPPQPPASLVDPAKMPMEGNFKWHQYQVVGRHLPTEENPTPTPYRMKLWATDAVRAKSKFWYFLGKQHKVKKAHGEIIACNEIFEKKPTTIKNFGIWLRYQSRTGVHNMYKEYRELTLNEAVNHMYQEMASRHRVRVPYIQIIKTAVVPAAQCKRKGVTQFHDSKIKFPLPAMGYRPGKSEFKSLFKAHMPNVSMR